MRMIPEIFSYKLFDCVGKLLRSRTMPVLAYIRYITRICPYMPIYARICPYTHQVPCLVRMDHPQQNLQQYPFDGKGIKIALIVEFIGVYHQV